MAIELTGEEASQICYALNMRINLIETGNYSFNAFDLERMGYKEAERLKVRIKHLTTYQQEIIASMRSIISKLSH